MNDDQNMIPGLGDRIADLGVETPPPPPLFLVERSSEMGPISGG